MVDLDGREELEQMKFEAGMHVKLDVDSNSGIAIRSGLLYRTLGTFVPTGIYADEFQRTYYLSIPLEFEFRGPGKTVRPILGAGVSFDTLLRARTRSFGMNARPDTDVVEEYRRVQWSAVGALGAQIGDHWTVRLRGSYGLTSFWRDGHLFKRNRSAAFEVGLWLPT